MATQKLWLRCTSCGLILRCPEKTISLPTHYTAAASSICQKKSFVILQEVDPEELRRADRERDRRSKKYLLKHPPKRKKAFEKKKNTSRWDGVRATSARPLRGTAGLPTLGKR